MKNEVITLSSGGAYMINVLRTKSDDFLNSVTNFEYRYLGGRNFEADLARVITPSGGNFLSEYKSYVKSTWEGFPSKVASVNQLKGYIQSGDPFEYIANVTKLHDVVNPEQFVKEQFQKVFEKDNYAIFDLFWNNPLYREKLGFDGLLKNDAKIIFHDLVDTLDIDLFDFVKVL